MLELCEYSQKLASLCLSKVEDARANGDVQIEFLGVLQVSLRDWLPNDQALNLSKT